MKHKSKLSFFCYLQALLLIVTVSVFAAADDAQEIGVPKPVVSRVNGCFDSYVFSDGVIHLGALEAKGNSNLADATKWLQLGTDTWVDTQNGIVYSITLVNGETQLLIHKGDSNNNMIYANPLKRKAA